MKLKEGNGDLNETGPIRLMQRRQALAAISAAAVVVGFDPVAGTWIREAEASCGSFPYHHVPDLDGTLYTDIATRQADQTDAGNIKFRLPAAVLRPGSVDDIVKMVKYCRQRNIKVAARGQGHTTFGHSLSCGLVIEMASLNTIHSIDSSGAVLDAGAQWFDLILESAAEGLTPPVLTGYTQLTIGGTLSVGGVSSTSGRGLQIDNVQWLDVVTGKGQLIRCSDTQHKKLFEAALGGLGQCGIIVRAKVNLIPAPEFVRLYNFYYLDNAQFFSDIRTLLYRDELDDIFNLWFPNGSGFLYQLNGAIGFNAGQEPDGDFLLRDLSMTPDQAQVTDIPYVDYVLRVDYLVDSYKTNLQWQDLIKPWFDIWLPDSTVEEYVDDVLPTLTAADIGTTGFLLLLPTRRSLLTRPFHPIPEDDGSDWIFLFDILTSSEQPGPDPVFRDQMLARNRALFEVARDVGATRYAISSIEFDHADWVQQYGDNWHEFKQRKQKYDPDNILTPGLGIFSC
ncbi:MAG: FAD-binding protein [Polyangiaceae bacterium]|nr:FAD-binding protein [Polyangiaceae bacterium]